MSLRGDPLSAAQLARRQWVPFQTPELQSLPVLSPEDVILQKLRWYEMTERGSERQWRDVLGVLKVHRGSPDEGYMRRQAEGAGLGQLLAEAIADGAGDG